MSPRAAVDPRILRLGLEEKVALLTGADLWHTRAHAGIGLRAIRFSDGPAGVRGPQWDERHPSVCLPSPTVLGATWDPSLAHAYGAVLAGEARRRGVHVVLAPTLNLHRSPLGGRNFEALGEDPALTATLAAAFVRGLQQHGVAATAKHFVANDYETERFTASSEVSDRALHEVYLLPFESAVVDGGAWVVMSSYNAVNGVLASEHPLLTDPLKTSWAFEGPVVGDWGGVRSIAAARSGQDLVMPGPDGPWGAALVAAVRAGEVTESLVDDKVARLLVLAERVGALGEETARPPAPDADAARTLAHEVAVDGMVLLDNPAAALPLRAETLTSVAVIGHNAATARIQGGGSATVLPDREPTTPVEALRARLPGVAVRHALGAVVQEGFAALPLDQTRHPETHGAGVSVRFLDGDGEELHREHRLSTDLVWFGGDAPVAAAARVELDLSWVPTSSGTVRLGFAAAGRGVVTVDGHEHVAGTARAPGRELGANPLRPPSLSGPLEVVAGAARRVRLVVDLDGGSRGRAGLLSLRLGLEASAEPPEQLVAEAARLAASADVAIVVVGTSSDVESEGFDREDLALPGAQDDLVRAVAATGTPAVVVVNAGAPIATPWRHDVAAVLATHFGGQEMGPALAEVLLGEREPGGRLPTTWPASVDELTPDLTPSEGRVVYAEGLHVGHRAWLRAERAPAYWFGHGLGYTTWRLSSLRLAPPDDQGTVRLALRVRNTGDRPGKQVVQAYLGHPGSTVERPVRWLAGHAVVRVGPAAEVDVELAIPRRRFAHWDSGAWRVEPGDYVVHVGTSADDLPLRGSVEVGAR